MLPFADALAQAGHSNSWDSTNNPDTLKYPHQNYDKDDYVEQALYRTGHRYVSVDQPHDKSGHD